MLKIDQKSLKITENDVKRCKNVEIPKKSLKIPNKYWKLTKIIKLYWKWGKKKQNHVKIPEKLLKIA